MSIATLESNVIAVSQYNQLQQQQIANITNTGLDTTQFLSNNMNGTSAQPYNGNNTNMIPNGYQQNGLVSPQQNNSYWANNNNNNNSNHNINQHPSINVPLQNHHHQYPINNNTQPLDFISETSKKSTSKQVIFILDTTAIMSIFFSFLKSNYLEPLSKLLQDESKNINIDYGLVLFRDKPPHGDYISQSTPLTTDIREIMSCLSNIKFNGGGEIYKGNYALFKGLESALNISSKKLADEKCFILITHSSARNTFTDSDLPGELLQNLSNQKIMLSFICPIKNSFLSNFYEKTSHGEAETNNYNIPDPFFIKIRGLPNFLPNSSSNNNSSNNSTVGGNNQAHQINVSAAIPYQENGYPGANGALNNGVNNNSNNTLAPPQNHVARFNQIASPNTHHIVNSPITSPPPGTPGNGINSSGNGNHSHFNQNNAYPVQNNNTNNNNNNNNNVINVDVETNPLTPSGNVNNNNYPNNGSIQGAGNGSPNNPIVLSSSTNGVNTGNNNNNQNLNVQNNIQQTDSALNSPSHPNIYSPNTHYNVNKLSKQSPQTPLNGNVAGNKSLSPNSTNINPNHINTSPQPPQPVFTQANTNGNGNINANTNNINTNQPSQLNRARSLSNFNNQPSTPPNPNNLNVPNNSNTTNNTSPQQIHNTSFSNGNNHSSLPQSPMTSNGMPLTPSNSTANSTVNNNQTQQTTQPSEIWRGTIGNFAYVSAFLAARATADPITLPDNLNIVGFIGRDEAPQNILKSPANIIALVPHPPNDSFLTFSKTLHNDKKFAIVELPNNYKMVIFIDPTNLNKLFGKMFQIDLNLLMSRDQSNNPIMSPINTNISSSQSTPSQPQASPLVAQNQYIQTVHNNGANMINQNIQTNGNNINQQNRLPNQPQPNMPNNNIPNNNMPNNNMPNNNMPNNIPNNIYKQSQVITNPHINNMPNNNMPNNNMPNNIPNNNMIPNNGIPNNMIKNMAQPVNPTNLNNNNSKPNVNPQFNNNINMNNNNINMMNNLNNNINMNQVVNMNQNNANMNNTMNNGINNMNNNISNGMNNINNNMNNINSMSNNINTNMNNIQLMQQFNNGNTNPNQVRTPMGNQQQGNQFIQQQQYGNNNNNNTAYGGQTAMNNNGNNMNAPMNGLNTPMNGINNAMNTGMNNNINNSGLLNNNMLANNIQSQLNNSGNNGMVQLNNTSGSLSMNNQMIGQMNINQINGLLMNQIQNQQQVNPNQQAQQQQQTQANLQVLQQQIGLTGNHQSSLSMNGMHLQNQQNPNQILNQIQQQQQYSLPSPSTNNIQTVSSPLQDDEHSSKRHKRSSSNITPTTTTKSKGKGNKPK